MSIQFRILFGLFFVALAGSGLLLWLALAWGNGFWAMAAPLGVGAMLSLVSWSFVRKL
ncbi:hypothetical protein [Gymnodinialimonas hymeniacidonis]|uniref:hypothetical protein n=1 Tax=Gymnodinialimonas hymeniacidonis TaxID=3126508 RepID=UPI0034C6901A